MILLEYDAKVVIAWRGIGVARGALVRSPLTRPLISRPHDGQSAGAADAARPVV